jgi:hypothetical protein
MIFKYVYASEHHVPLKNAKFWIQILNFDVSLCSFDALTPSFHGEISVEREKTTGLPAQKSKERGCGHSGYQLAVDLVRFHVENPRNNGKIMGTTWEIMDFITGNCD